ncbi:MAG: hypothetical protein ACREO4_09350 [Lysobacter sp.]
MSLLTLENSHKTKLQALDGAAQAYAGFTVGTAQYPTDIAALAGNVSAGLLYVAIGLANEVGELAELFDREALSDQFRAERYTKAWKELGDVQWYAARLCDELPELPTFRSYVARAYETITDRPSEVRLSGYDVQSGLCAAAGIILGVVKKMMRDGADWSPEKREQKIAELDVALFHVISISVEFAERTGPLVDCSGGYIGLLRCNSDKLQDRKDRGVLKGDGDNR